MGSCCSPDLEGVPDQPEATMALTLLWLHWDHLVESTEGSYTLTLTDLSLGLVVSLLAHVPICIWALGEANAWRKATSRLAGSS